jgi:hypothetical protein
MQFFNRVKTYVLQYKVLLVLYVIVTLFSYWQLIESDHLNNFYIFRASSYHLLKGLPLYIEYPAEYFDLFYYNPVFPVLFMPFALLPLKAGILLWISVTAIGCYVMFRQLPMLDSDRKVFIFLIMFDVMNNLTHTQTNPLLFAFMLLSWTMLAKRKPFWAALFMTLSFLIKGYGGIIGLLCFYYKSWYKVILYGIFWMLAINSLLLLFMPLDAAIQYYKDWLAIISSDTIKESYSVYGLVKNLHWNISETYILLTAFITLAAYVVMQYVSGARTMKHLVAFLLVWVTVFNRASEPATYIIAMGGAILWYLSRPKNTLSTIIFWLTITISTLIPTDIWPYFDKIKYDYYLKSIFCLLILTDMFAYTSNQLAIKLNSRKAADA